MTNGNLIGEEDIDMNALDNTGNLSMRKVMSRKEVDLQP
jgi:hypothetical protein